MKLKDEVIKQLLEQLGFSLGHKDYQSHYDVAMYVLDNFWEDKHDFTELEQESVDEFVAAFPKTRDLYDRLFVIAERKTKIRRIIDPNAKKILAHTVGIFVNKIIGYSPLQFERLNIV